MELRALILNTVIHLDPGFDSHFDQKWGNLSLSQKWISTNLAMNFGLESKVATSDISVLIGFHPVSPLANSTFVKYLAFQIGLSHRILLTLGLVWAAVWTAPFSCHQVFVSSFHSIFSRVGLLRTNVSQAFALPWPQVFLPSPLQSWLVSSTLNNNLLLYPNIGALSL